MVKTAVDRRNSSRFRLPEGSSACVDFEHPPRGPGFSMELYDISVSSISFMFRDEFSGLEIGSEIDGVVIRVGQTELHGDLVVMHVSPFGSRSLCGAMFYPASDSDLVALKETVAQLEAEQTG